MAYPPAPCTLVTMMGNTPSRGGPRDNNTPTNKVPQQERLKPTLIACITSTINRPDAECSYMQPDDFGGGPCVFVYVRVGSTITSMAHKSFRLIINGSKRYVQSGATSAVGWKRILLTAVSCSLATVAKGDGRVPRVIME